MSCFQRLKIHRLFILLSFLVFRWHIQNPGKCSARCGPGYQTRIVRCMRVTNDRWGMVLDKHCPANTKPSEVIPCTGTCEGTKWVYTEWSKVFITYFYLLHYEGSTWFKSVQLLDGTNRKVEATSIPS